MPEISEIHSHIDGRNVKRFRGFDAADYRDLARIGIVLPDRELAAMVDASGMDALQPSITTGSINTPLQFLQTWLPGFVNVITAARKVDELVGITTAGAWEDEQIVQGVLEQLGTSVPYGDYTNVPLSSWNVNFNYRTVVRFEEGMRVGNLEEARASRMKVNSAANKREAATLALEIQRNSVGFFGYNGGDNNTYGYLNDTGLPSYVEVPATGTGGSTTWASKTFQQIQTDIRTALVALRTQSQDTIDPKTTPITMGIASAAVDYLSTTTDQGVSVQSWMDEAYPKIRVVSAPELNAANASLNVLYFQADEVADGSSDDGKTWLQMVPAKFRVNGVQQLTKGYEESYSNATAGVMLKRPYAVVRYYGV
jgi:hypothetical protein